jgi:hypothetical protein
MPWGRREGMEERDGIMNRTMGLDRERGERVHVII